MGIRISVPRTAPILRGNTQNLGIEGPEPFWLPSERCGHAHIGGHNGCDPSAPDAPHPVRTVT
ncbi:hypothetical protein MVI01_72990 [Myxococcus virescens]|uniref:Uncharacterized protein n=1 Tax=Myxococcus virescens TaxID=83456 RepID=A0A511HQ57_9BACT|nr:hypothetical protein MVI01_72990 [Myxococcus virescens]